MSAESLPPPIPLDIPSEAPDAPAPPVRPGEAPAPAGLSITSYFTDSPPVRAMGVFVVVAAALAFMHLATPILNPVMLGIFFVTLSLPAYRWLNARHINKGLVLLALMLAILLIGIGLALLFYASGKALQEGLQAYSAQIDAAVQEAQQQLQALGVEVSSSTASGASDAARGALATIAGVLVDAVSAFTIAAILAAFLLLESSRIGSLLRTSMRELPFLGLTPQVMTAAVVYFFIRIRLNILTGALFGLSLWLLGVDYAWLWGLLTVVLSFVPYIGLVIAAAPATILAFAEYGAGRAIAVVLIVIVINGVVENIVAPTYTGKSLSLSTAVVFVAFLFWIWLLGPLGALLAMPITVLLMLTFARYESTRWLAELISGGELPQL